MNLWYWVSEEFKALGLRCVAHGPEFWLVVPLALGVLVIALIVARDIWGGD